jgi:hypothetical protein
MRNLLLVAVVASLALAGCSYKTGRPGGSVDTGTSAPPPEPEDDSGVLAIAFHSEGPATIEVPLPSLDSCRAADAWMEGEVSAQGASVELRDATAGRHGRVLAVTGQGDVSWSTQIELGPVCNNIRYDPWSIDPDANGTAVEVRVAEGEVSGPSVLVRRVRDDCIEATLYEGEVAGNDWTALEGRTLQDC